MTRIAARPAAIVVLVVAAVVALPARASGPPVPTQPPELFSRISWFTAGSSKLDVEAFVQFARPDSLDLAQLAPAAAPVARVEAGIHPDLLILHSRHADPRLYRVRVPVGSPITCNYTVKLDATPAARHVVGPDYICMWLGEALLAPLRPEKLAALADLDASKLDAPTLDATAGAERFWLEMRVLDNWRAVGPWRKQDKAYRPASLADQIDNFVALGNWRVEMQLLGPGAQATAAPAASPRSKTKPAVSSPTWESEAAACTLHVALAGKLPIADADWRQRAGQEIAAAGIGGRGLVCVAPVAGPLRVLRARNSWLVLWPADRAELPPAPRREPPAADEKRLPFAWEP